MRLGNAVNTVWNYCNEISQRGPKWATKKQLRDLTKGAGRELDLPSQVLPSQVLPSQVVQEVIDEFIIKRRAAGRPQLRWRKSFGSKLSLGWLPSPTRTLRSKDRSRCCAGRNSASGSTATSSAGSSPATSPGCPRPLVLQFGVRDRAAGAGQPQQGGWLARSSRTPRPRRSRKSVRNVAPST